MTKTALEQKRKTNHQARSHGGTDPEADLGASEAIQSAVRPGDSNNGPSRTSGESFLAHPAQALWAASGMFAIVVLIAILVPAGPLGLDRSWSEAMNHLETPLLTDLALVFNWVGRGVGRAIALMLVELLLLRRRRWLALVTFAAAESLAPLLSTLLKVLVDRSRPPDQLVHPFGPSFPSGHATYAGATCIALVMLFTTPGTHRRWWWALASLGVVGMAWSRTYLQVHWLTDVIAGALLGSSISLLVFAIAQKHVSAANGATCRPGRAVDASALRIDPRHHDGDDRVATGRVETPLKKRRGGGNRPPELVHVRPRPHPFGPTFCTARQGD